MFGSAKLTKNVDSDKNKCSGYGIGFDFRSEFLFTDGSTQWNVITFGAYMSSSLHVDNKNKYILILCVVTQGWDDTALTAEPKCPISFTQQKRRFVLSLHYLGRNSFLFVNAKKYISWKQRTPK